MAKKKPKYVYLLRNKFLTTNATSMDEFIETYQDMSTMLADWKEAGIELDPESDISSDYAMFFTHDPVVAKNYGFDDERDFWGDDEEEDEEQELDKDTGKVVKDNESEELDFSDD